MALQAAITGMTPEVIASAFDPFFTTKPIGMGTGLGLSMIYGFARQSNGQVRIYSEIGQGTTMCLYLPRHHGQADGADTPAELAEMPRAEQGETVLVVDDEPTVRMLVTEVLEDLGYTAIEAELDRAKRKPSKRYACQIGTFGSEVTTMPILVHAIPERAIGFYLDFGSTIRTSNL